MIWAYVTKDEETCEALKAHVREALGHRIISECDYRFILHGENKIYVVCGEPDEEFYFIENKADRLYMDLAIQTKPCMAWRKAFRIGDDVVVDHADLDNMLKSLPDDHFGIPLDPWNGFIAACSIRYAFGATSYAPGVVCNWIMNHWDEFGEVEQGKLKAELLRLIAEAGAEEDSRVYAHWHMLLRWMDEIDPVEVPEGDKIRNFAMTCSGCPSQWDAETVGGRAVYIRYRWGYLSVCVAGDDGDAVCGEEILGKQCGDSLDGCMSESQLKCHLDQAGLLVEGEREES